MDTNNDGQICYSEFQAATANRISLINKDNIQVVFKYFDIDGDGVITKDELKRTFIGQKHGDDDLWNNVFKDIDKDGDQQITFEEFHDAIMAGMASQ